MPNTIVSHLATGCVAAVLGSATTYALIPGPGEVSNEVAAVPEVPTGATGNALQRLLFETTMDDVLGRVAMVREFERAPGTGGTPHRHPGTHAFGYVLEGTYEVKVDDGPLRRLEAGETFYEPPGALHAVSRNGSSTEPARYLVFTVSDPTFPATVPE